MYFKGKWATPFNPKQTHDAEFHRADGSTVQVRMMSSREEGFRVYYDYELGFEMAVSAVRGAALLDGAAGARP